MDFYSQLHALLCEDATGRGLAAAAPAPDFDAVTRTLRSARRAVILTGFPVDCGPEGVRGETDGPGGSAELARALEAAGCAVTLLTDGVSFPLVSAAAECLELTAEVVCLPAEDTEAFGRRLMTRLQPTHFIALERPGKAADGHFYNMRGRIIDDMVTDSDFLLPLAREMGAVTIGVGDGGNELGMGSLRSMIAARTPLPVEYAAAQEADLALTSGVSNWWGWGASALLSRAVGHWLLPSPAEEFQVLSAVVAAGGVDGCTHAAELTVDAQPLASHQALLRRIADALRAAAPVQAAI